MAYHWPGAGVALLVVNRIGCAVLPAATSAPLAIVVPTNSPVDPAKRSVAPGLMVRVDGVLASFATVTLPRMAYGTPRFDQVVSADRVSPRISARLLAPVPVNVLVDRPAAACAPTRRLRVALL